MVEREGDVMACCGGKTNPISNLETKWGALVDSIQIPTWTERLTLCYLAELASKSKIGIEIGTYLGKSAKVMLSANPNLILHCIDTFECRGEPKMIEYMNSLGITPETVKNSNLKYGIESYDQITTGQLCRFYSLSSEVVEGRCHLMKGKSESAAYFLIKYDGEKCVDYVWIDGGHQEWQVWDDCRYMLPVLKNGGEMLGHDYDQNPPNDVCIGVRAAFQPQDIRVPVPRLWSVINRPGLTLGPRPPQ